MNDKEAEYMARLLLAIESADPDQTITFKTTMKDTQNVQVLIPASWQKDLEFNRKILELGSFPSRWFTSEKAQTKNKRKFKHIIVYIDTISTLDIVDLEKKVKEFTSHEHTHSPLEWAHLVLHVFRTWNTLPGELKQHRKITEDIVKGYMKQRENYRHGEIIEALQTYGKWAEAKMLSVRDGEIDAFWFHRWDLDSLLRSNKSMNHIADGWPELVRAKGIPSDYSRHREVSPADLEAKNRRVEMVAQKIVKDEDIDSIKFIYDEYKTEIDARVEELRGKND